MQVQVYITRFSVHLAITALNYENAESTAFVASLSSDFEHIGAIQVIYYYVPFRVIYLMNQSFTYIFFQYLHVLTCFL